MDWLKRPFAKNGPTPTWFEGQSGDTDYDGNLNVKINKRSGVFLNARRPWDVFDTLFPDTYGHINAGLMLGFTNSAQRPTRAEADRLIARVERALRTHGVSRFDTDTLPPTAYWRPEPARAPVPTRRPLQLGEPLNARTAGTLARIRDEVAQASGPVLGHRNATAKLLLGKKRGRTANGNGNGNGAKKGAN
jgi:hypothetical protein